MSLSCGRKLGILIAVLGALGGSAGTTAAAMEPSLASLKGLGQGIGVVVREFSPEVQKTGLKEEVAQREVAQRLAQSDIRVADEGDSELVVELNASYLRASGLYSYSVVLSLGQDVILARDPSIQTQAFTWIRSAVGTSFSASFRATVLGALRMVTDAFANDYLLANPVD